jgi:hypothetical protein
MLIVDAVQGFEGVYLECFFADFVLNRAAPSSFDLATKAGPPVRVAHRLQPLVLGASPPRRERAYLHS